MAPNKIVAKPNHERGAGQGSPSTSASTMALGMGTTDRMTMKVSTLDTPTTALPAVMVTKNMPAAGKNLINFPMSSASTSMIPSLPATNVTLAAKTNCTVANVQTYGKRFRAHLFTTSSEAAQVAWPATKIRTLALDAAETYLSSSSARARGAGCSTKAALDFDLPTTAPPSTDAAKAPRSTSGCGEYGSSSSPAPARRAVRPPILRWRLAALLDAAARRAARPKPPARTPARDRAANTAARAADREAVGEPVGTAPAAQPQQRSPRAKPMARPRASGGCGSSAGARRGAGMAAARAGERARAAGSVGAMGAEGASGARRGEAYSPDAV
mmetsp:Transcript_80892/g.210784  ORF Transcript_80892/g.210784 Transcript_80892/m.210784 type:complete len:329 (+) Transcript_80892:767-1753(+)